MSIYYQCPAIYFRFFRFKGEALGACPYYSSRTAVQRAPQVICVPYNNLFHADIRTSLGRCHFYYMFNEYSQFRLIVGIRLHRNTCILIDEAHNLSDAICSIHSLSLPAQHLAFALEALRCYCDRFGKIISPKKLYHINVFNSICLSLKNYLKNTAGDPSTGTTEIVNANEFMFKLKIDNINIIQLKKYLQFMNISGKVGGFAEYYYAKNSPHVQNLITAKRNYVGALRNILEFLEKLMNLDINCKLVVYHGLSQNSVQSLNAR